MKKLILLLLISFSGFGQENKQLKLSVNGFEPIVVEVLNKNEADIYLKAKAWVQTYYKNPSEVLKADIQNEMIRIEGFAVGGFKTKALGIVNSLDYDYTIEIEFKDGKYRFNYIVGQFYSKGQKAFYSYKTFFKSDNSIRKVHQFSFETLNETANETNISLYNYITGKTNSEKNDW